MCLPYYNRSPFSCLHIAVREEGPLEFGHVILGDVVRQRVLSEPGGATP